jgi:nitroimidazol reductase NimA-like FMN-containing flavoprotein (pyridoxamine 5'-phosphate oxidase superfamily)
MAYHMRRQDRQVVNRDEIDDILKRGKFVVLSLCRDNEPYIVTLSYGYDQASNCLYLHCANQGLKLDFIRENPLVCGTVIIDKGYLSDQCAHEYETVVFRGDVQFLSTLQEKRLAMACLMNHLEADPQPIIERNLKTDAAYHGVTLLKLAIKEITGKWGR